VKIAVSGSAGGNGRLIPNETERRGYGAAGFARLADALAGAGAPRCCLVSAQSLST
jgi:putative NADH-flavin reductase